MRFYINLSSYTVLELEGKMINYELVDDDVIVRYNHIDNGVYAPEKVAIKNFTEFCQTDVPNLFVLKQ